MRKAETPMKAQKPEWLSIAEFRYLVEKRHWSLLSWSSGIVAMVFISYYALQIPLGVQSIGSQFVLSEWPPPTLSPYFYAKPITWFSYFSFLYWAFGLESFRTRFLSMSYRARRFLFIGTAFIGFGAFYEIFFNFTIWSALLAVCSASPSQCSPDTLVNIYPNLRTPLNLTFATKVVTTVFGLSVYSVWFLHRIDKDLDRKAQGVSID
jgi:hypothetical protein